MTSILFKILFVMVNSQSYRRRAFKNTISLDVIKLRYSNGLETLRTPEGNLRSVDKYKTLLGLQGPACDSREYSRTPRIRHEAES